MKKEYLTPTYIIHEIHGAMAILDGAATGGMENPPSGGSSDYDNQGSEDAGARAEGFNVWKEW